MDTRIVSLESHPDQVVFGLSQNMGSRVNMEDRIETRFLQTAGGLNLFVAMVADGIGGHNCGEVASERTIQTVFQQISASPLSSPSQIPQMLADALLAANSAVYQESREDLKKSGMGTTATIAVIDNNHLYIANVGDSRAYLIRGKALVQLTVDHTWAREMVHQGHLSLEEAEAHPKGGALVRSIGYDQQVKVDLGLYISGEESEQQARQNQGLPLQATDHILLCSDGLIKERRDHSGHFVENDEILNLIAKKSPDKAAQTLVQKAVSRQADDNVSAIVIALSTKAQGTAVLWKLIVGLLIVIILLALGYLGYTAFAGGQLMPAPTPSPDSLVAVANVTETAVPTPTPVPTSRPNTSVFTTISIEKNRGGLFLDDGTQITTNSVRVSPGQAIRNSVGVSEIALTDGSTLSLDEASTIKLLAFAGLADANQTVFEPQSNSQLLASAISPLQFRAPGSSMEYAQVESNGLAVVSYSESPFFFEIACLQGICEINMLGINTQLNPSESICVGGGCENGSRVESIAYERYTHLSPLVPTPTNTPTPTPTATNTPTPTWTPTPTLTNTPSPTPTSTPPASAPEPEKPSEPESTPAPEATDSDAETIELPTTSP